MQKQAPSIGRILVAIGFALSCFALLLFFWIAFGGPTPLKPQSYRFTADFPEATTLALESDVRISGVTVGQVKELELPPDINATRATIEIEPEFAPISENAKAILRQKTLLGETYVELTSGTEPGRRAAPVSLGAQGGATDAQTEGVEQLPEGGHLATSRVQDATQIDEIFNALDEETRESFQRWQANAAVAIQDRGLDLNDSFGNLGPFLTDASDVVEILERQKVALQGVVRDTGETFEALTERDQALAGVITNSNDTFSALAQEERALADTFKIFPTFERETRATLERLDEFQANTRPLVQDLIPVTRDISPTLRSVRRLSPPLRRLFVDLDKLVKVSKRGLPALRRFLGGLGPVFDNLDPFLANLNPVVRFLGAYRHTVSDFLANPTAAMSGTLPQVPGQPAGRHFLRNQLYTSSESLGVHQERLDTNRGNGYLQPLSINSESPAIAGMPFPSFDCRNVNGDDSGTTAQNDPRVGPAFAPCITPSNFGSEFGGKRAPNLFADP
jgi:phospholipid/cholesterol/gamma-HCH transport system substrate-binding protein